MPARFKDRTMQAMYETCRRLAADPTSEFYVAGKPRRGAAHRNAYWNGREGVQPLALPKNTPAYAAWRAGADDRADATKS